MLRDIVRLLGRIKGHGVGVKTGRKTTTRLIAKSTLFRAHRIPIVLTKRAIFNAKTNFHIVNQPK